MTLPDCASDYSEEREATFLLGPATLSRLHKDKSPCADYATALCWQRTRPVVGSQSLCLLGSIRQVIKICCFAGDHLSWISLPIWVSLAISSAAIRQSVSGLLKTRAVVPHSVANCHNQEPVLNCLIGTKLIVAISTDITGRNQKRKKKCCHEPKPEAYSSSMHDEPSYEFRTSTRPRKTDSINFFAHVLAGNPRSPTHSIFTSIPRTGQTFQIRTTRRTHVICLPAAECLGYRPKHHAQFQSAGQTSEFRLSKA